MTRWGTGVPCPRRCGGKVEAWFETAEGESRGKYMFCCTHCDLQGDWAQLARNRLSRKGKR